MSESDSACFIRRFVHYLFRQDFADAPEPRMAERVAVIIDRYSVAIFSVGAFGNYDDGIT